MLRLGLFVRTQCQVSMVGREQALSPEPFVTNRQVLSQSETSSQAPALWRLYERFQSCDRIGRSLAAQDP
jgi:hypothetical protein